MRLDSAAEKEVFASELSQRSTPKISSLLLVRIILCMLGQADQLKTCFYSSISEDVDLHWLWVAVVGLIVGALAKFLMPGKDPGGLIVTILIGIGGSIVATCLGRAVGWYQGAQSAGFLMSVAGAVVLLSIYHFLKRRSA